MIEVSSLDDCKNTACKITYVAHEGPCSVPSVLKMKVSIFFLSSSNC